MYGRRRTEDVGGAAGRRRRRDQDEYRLEIPQKVPSRSSPTLVGDLLYFANEAGILSCIDAKNADFIWQERLGGSFWASPIYADGRLYLFDNKGTSTVGETVGRGRNWRRTSSTTAVWRRRP